MADKQTIDLIQKARNLTNSQEIRKSKKAYLKAIKNLKKSVNTDQDKAELWTTEAEYLMFNAKFLSPNETIEDSRKRMISALRLLYRTSKLNSDFKKQIDPKIREVLDNTISTFGCIIPENEKQVHVSCPIRIRNTGAANMGFSAGMFFKQATCSICKREILDPDCNHIAGEIYEGKTCQVIQEGLTIDHVSMTENPKDPNCGITEIWYPKKDFYEGFTEQEIETKERKKLPFVCNICKLNKIKPTEIDIEKFFKMQHLRL